jgi:hypothetical protein
MYLRRLKSARAGKATVGSSLVPRRLRAAKDTTATIVGVEVNTNLLKAPARKGIA